MALAVVAGLGAAVVATGCSTGQAAAGSTASCPATPGVTPGQITFGLLYPASGAVAGSVRAYRAGVDARLGAVNATGGVHGRKLAYTWADDQGSPDQNLTAAQKLVSTDNAFVVQEFSPESRGSAAWLNRQGVPVVGTASDPIWTRYPTMFSYIDGNAGSVTSWGDYAASQGVKKAVVVYSAFSEGSLTMGKGFHASLVSARIPTQMVEVEPKSLDLPAVVRTIQATGADLITGITDAESFIKVVLAVRDAVPNIKILSLMGYDPGILAVGRRLAGMTVILGYQPFERKTQAQQRFLDAMAEYAPQQQPAASQIALSGWLDTDLLVRGLEAAGPCPTRPTFTTNLRAVSDYDAGGLLAAPVDLNATLGQAKVCYSVVQISPDGSRFVPVGAGPLCGRHIG